MDISGSGGGIGVEVRGSSNTVENVNASSRDTGIYVPDSAADIQLLGNNVSGAASYGIHLHDPSIPPTPFSNITISGNDASYSSGHGILGDAIWGLTVSGLTISDNNVSHSAGSGVYAPGALTNATVSGNDASYCGGHGIRINATGDDVHIYHNNIAGNGLNVWAAGPIELSFHGEGNYWGHDCPGPLFEPGVDSSSVDVVDSYPYGTAGGWLTGPPGCPCPYPADTDCDGCADSEEPAGASAPKPGSTGAYDPAAWYDFYDVPVPANPDPTPNGERNQAVTIGDVLAVLFYVGAADEDPPNSNGVDYDSVKGSCDRDENADTTLDEEGLCYDRSPSAEPNPPWEAGPPDGAVTIQDVLAVLAQVGLACSGAPYRRPSGLHRVA